MVLSLALCSPDLNILTGYQEGGLLMRKSIHGRKLLKLARANDAWEEAPTHDVWEEEIPRPPSPPVGV
jgi:hypothetical protein